MCCWSAAGSLFFALLSTPAAEVAVIGAGWGRTGTMSLKKALERLGHKTYHMQDIIDVENHHASMWIDIAQSYHSGKPLAGRFRTLFENYTAVVDFPVAAWWKEILEDFPNAKVILSKREAESWYQSSLDTTFAFTKSWQIKAIRLFSPFFKTHAKMCQAAIWDKVIGPGLDPALPELHEKTIAAYEASAQLVRTTLSRDHPFLDWKVGEGGWDPLCTFLDVSADKCPSNEGFPHANDRQAFFMAFLLPITVVLIVIFSSPFWAVALIFFCCCRHQCQGSKLNREKVA